MTRKRALVVTPQMPWPLDDGGKIGLWQQLWSVAQGYATTLVTLVPARDAQRPVPEPVRAVAHEIVTIEHTPPPRWGTAVAGIFGPWPHTLARYRCGALEVALRRHASEGGFAVAVLNHLHMATYREALAGIPTALREFNVEHLWLERYAETLRSPIERLYIRHQARRMRRAESELCARATLVLAVSEFEAALLRAISPSAHVEAVPLGIDFDRFGPRQVESPPIVLLAAAFGWPPNADGARQFVSRGWANVRKLVPNARLRIAGKNISESLARDARAAGAEVAGYVDSMADEYSRASVLVVPLWAGAGTRVKIIEALAACLPVVSTPIGAEGLSLEAGTHFLEATSPELLGTAVAKLLGDRDRSERLAQAGLEKAKKTFSLQSIALQNLRLLESMERSAQAEAR